MDIKRLLNSLPVAGVLVLLVMAAPVRAQTAPPAAANHLTPAIHFKRLTSDDGLVQNGIEAILQDSQGFMWFGTTGGLSRYDGYEFVTYQHEADKPGLNESWVRDIYEDADGFLWIGTEGGGVNRFDPRTGTFTYLTSDPKNPNTLLGNRVFEISQDSDGHFWFVGGGTTGLNRFDPQTQTFARYRTSPPDQADFQGGAVWSMVEDSHNNLWMVGESVLAKYDPQTDTFTYFRPPEGTKAPENRMITLFMPQEGTLWIGGNQGLYTFDIATETFTDAIPMGAVQEMVQDDSGIFWIATFSGLVMFDPQTRQIITTYHQDSTRVDSLSSDALTEIYRDREGIIWTGTGDGGVNSFDPRALRFAHYRHDEGSDASLAKDTVDAIYASDENHVLVATGSILNQVNLATGQVTQFPVKLEDGSTPDIGAIYQERSGIIWLGLKSPGLVQFDPATATMTSFPIKSQVTNRPTPPKGVVDLYEAPDGALWIAVNHDGLYRLDADRKTMTFVESPIPASSRELTPVPQVRAPINDIYPDHEGNLWIATFNGFHRFHPDTGTFDTYRLVKSGNGAPESYIESFYEDDRGILWVASREGLIRFDPATEDAKTYTTQDGLPTGYIVGILPDNAGNLWISTKKGLSRFNPVDETFRNYDAADGLQGNEFGSRIFARLPDGRLIFGGTHGINVFSPEAITDSPYQPAVVLTDFELDNESVPISTDSILTQPITDTRSLTLEYSQKILSFEFASLSYDVPQKNRYRYRLEPFEDEWKETGSNRRFVTYTNLPAGDYIFHVQGSNADGTWSDHEVALNLTILPPWWEMGWFRALLIIVVIALVFAGYQWRVYAMAKRNRELEKEVNRQTASLQQRTRELQASESQLRHAKDAAEAANRAKSAFLASMSHELRSPLNAILGFAQVTSRIPSVSRDVNDNLGIILRSGEHLLALINQVLDLSKIEAGHMLLNEFDFDLYRLLDEVEDMFILRADDKRITLAFDTAPDLPRYLHTDAVKLRQVLINLIGNALKFTEKGTVTVRARKLASASANGSSTVTLQFEVQDTGAGIAPEEIPTLFQPFTQTDTGRKAQEGTGLGLTISRRFVELMGGTISVRSEIGQGTTFTFQVQCREIAAIEHTASSGGRHIVGLQPGQPQHRILIVDDKWVNRQLLVKLLGPLGFDLREAENGREAVDIAGAFLPHLIWMDMRMPVMDGIEATRRIKATPQGQTMVIIALTASAYDEERADILAAGCDAFVRKPFRAEDIFDILNQHIGVQYVYVQDDVPVSNGHVLLPPADLKAAVHSLPPDLLLRLIESTELGDVDDIEMNITEVHRHQPALADTFARLAHRFEYSQMLDMLKDAP